MVLVYRSFAFDVRMKRRKNAILVNVENSQMADIGPGTRIVVK